MNRRLQTIAAALCAAGLTASADVALHAEADGVFRAASSNYIAVVGADGNLHSLQSRGTEFLLDGYKGLVGGAYLTITEGPTWTVEAFRFDRVERTGTHAVTATADAHKLVYTFADDAIELAFSHTREPTIWYLTLNPAVTHMVEKHSGETIPPKTVWREGMPQAFDSAGANVTFPNGALYYIAKNAREKPDTDPEVLQVWMPRTWGTSSLTNRLLIHAKPTVADALRTTLSLSPGNHLFPGGQPAGLGIEGRLCFPGIPLHAKVDLSVAEFRTKKRAFAGTQAFDLPPLGSGTLSFAVVTPPGFYSAVMTAKDGEHVLAERRFCYAYDMEHMAPPARPADFDAFWDETLAEQAKVPANVELSLSKEEEGYRLYRMHFDGLLGRRFYAWLSVPVEPGKYPAHLTLPPSGINKPYLPYRSPQVVGMSLAIAGQDLEPPDGGYAYWDYWRSGIETRETWYYRAVYAACSRAVDLLVARPEVDGTRIFVAGGSQGGGLSFITAGLNTNVAMAVCSSPGLFGLEWKLRDLGRAFWPPIDPVDAKGQPISDPHALETRVAVARYGDAASFAPRIRCAVLLNIGLQDHVTSQVGTVAAWSQLRHARIRAILADPWGGHNGPRGGQWLTTTWFQALAAGHLERVLRVSEAGGLPVVVETPTSEGAGARPSPALPDSRTDRRTADREGKASTI